MLFGFSRYEAARFSFLLAVPITFGLGVKKLLDLTASTGAVDWLPVLVAAIVCYVTALLTIRFFLVFIRNYTLWPFIWYNIILACLVGYVAVFV
jgi:undecaprenyl-diphosphatase